MSDQFENNDTNEPFEPVTKGKIQWIHEPPKEVYRERKSGRPYKNARSGGVPKSAIFCILIVFLAIGGANAPLLKGLGTIGALVTFFALCSSFFRGSEVKGINKVDQDDSFLEMSQDSPLFEHSMIDGMTGIDPVAKSIYGID